MIDNMTEGSLSLLLVDVCKFDNMTEASLSLLLVDVCMFGNSWALLWSKSIPSTSVLFSFYSTQSIPQQK